MDTNPKGHRVALVPEKYAITGLLLALVVASAFPLVAEEGYLEVENCFSTSYADEFTDEITDAMLGCAEPSAANYDDVRAGVFFGFKRGENYYLALLEKGRINNVPDDGASVEVALRIGSHPAITRQATWNTQSEMAWMWVGADLIAKIRKEIVDADKVIYRIGPQGEVLTIPLSDQMTMLIDDFLPRVAAIIASST